MIALNPFTYHERPPAQGALGGERITEQFACAQMAVRVARQRRPKAQEEIRVQPAGEAGPAGGERVHHFVARGAVNGELAAGGVRHGGDLKGKERVVGGQRLPVRPAQARLEREGGGDLNRQGRRLAGVNDPAAVALGQLHAFVQERDRACRRVHHAVARAHLDVVHDHAAVLEARQRLQDDRLVGVADRVNRAVEQGVQDAGAGRNVGRVQIEGEGLVLLANYQLNGHRGGRGYGGERGAGAGGRRVNRGVGGGEDGGLRRACKRRWGRGRGAGSQQA